jgi:hypothetical protein
VLDLAERADIDEVPTEDAILEGFPAKIEVDSCDDLELESRDVVAGRTYSLDLIGDTPDCEEDFATLT